MDIQLTTTDHSSFVLRKGSEDIANIKYNQQSHSIRINAVQRRLFFMSAAGLLQNKIMLETEYGVGIGENYHLRNQHKGILYLADRKYNYTISKNGVSVRDRNKNVIANCSFENADKADSFEISAVLFSITWLYNPTYKDEIRPGLPVA